MKTRYVILGLLIAILLGYGIGRYIQPAEVKTETKVVEKVVERVKKDITIVERETKLPDGTVIVDRRTEDKSSETSRSDRSSEQTVTVTKAKSQWTASAGAKISLNDFKPAYGAKVGYRAIGPVWVELGGFSDGTGMMFITYEF